MLNKMIQWSLANRAVVLAVSILVMVMGIRTATELPVEVLPDLTKPTVVILVEALLIVRVQICRRHFGDTKSEALLAWNGLMHCQRHF